MIITLMTLGYGGIWTTLIGMSICNLGIFCGQKMFKTGIGIGILGFVFLTVITGISVISDPTETLIVLNNAPSIKLAFVDWLIHIYA